MGIAIILQDLLFSFENIVVTLFFFFFFLFLTAVSCHPWKARATKRAFCLVPTWPLLSLHGHSWEAEGGAGMQASLCTCVVRCCAWQWGPAAHSIGEGVPGPRMLLTRVSPAFSKRRNRQGATISEGGGKKHRSRITKQRGCRAYIYEENCPAARQDGP